MAPAGCFVRGGKLPRCCAKGPIGPINDQWHVSMMSEVHHFDMNTFRIKTFWINLVLHAYSYFYLQLIIMTIELKLGHENVYIYRKSDGIAREREREGGGEIKCTSNLVSNSDFGCYYCHGTGTDRETPLPFHHVHSQVQHCSPEERVSKESTHEHEPTPTPVLYCVVCSSIHAGWLCL